MNQEEEFKQWYNSNCEILRLLENKWENLETAEKQNLISQKNKLYGCFKYAEKRGRQLQKEEYTKEWLLMVEENNNLFEENQQLKEQIEALKSPLVQVIVKRLNNDLLCLSCGKLKANFCGKCFLNKTRQ